MQTKHQKTQKMPKKSIQRKTIRNKQKKTNFDTNPFPFQPNPFHSPAVVSIAQLVWTMHNIYKVRGPATTKKKPIPFPNSHKK